MRKEVSIVAVTDSSSGKAFGRQRSTAHDGKRWSTFQCGRFGHEEVQQASMSFPHAPHGHCGVKALD